MVLALCEVAGYDGSTGLAEAHLHELSDAVDGVQQLVGLHGCGIAGCGHRVLVAAQRVEGYALHQSHHGLDGLISHTPHIMHHHDHSIRSKNKRGREWKSD